MNFPSPGPGLVVELAEADVHIWAVDLDAARDRHPQRLDVLSIDERHRAARFRFEVDRRHFVSARAALRHILAPYAGADPAALRFWYGPRGKPVLANQPALHFNLGHSRTLALVAVTLVGPIGVDVEFCRPLPELHDLARQVLSVGEQAHLLRLPQGVAERFFLTCWTRKEAYVKALGDGVGYMLDLVDVTDRAEKSGPVRVRDLTRAASPWLVWDLHPTRDYLAALAVPDERITLHCWCWQNEDTA